MIRLLVGCVFISLVGVTIAGVAAEDSNWHRVEGKIIRITRSCTFDILTTTGEGKKSFKSEDDSCNATNEFAQARIDHEKKGRDIVGKAKLTVQYDVPQGETGLGMIELTGRDDAFYTAKKGDAIKLMVNKADPETIKLPL